MNTVLGKLADLNEVVAQIVPEYSPPAAMASSDERLDVLPFIIAGAVSLGVLLLITLWLKRRRRNRRYSAR
jgi:hypothetical protein